MYSGHISSRPRANAGSAAVEDNREARADHSGGSVTVISSSLAASEEAVHTRLWERSLELQHRRAAEECRREETRRARATEGHVNDRSTPSLKIQIQYANDAKIYAMFIIPCKPITPLEGGYSVVFI